MVGLIIIADDFTGALDTGVQFSQAGIRTVVAVGHADLTRLPPDVQALVVDTESRHLPPQAAYAAVQRLAQGARLRGIPYLYKKTDSTLRGNLGAELQAVLDAYGGAPVMFAPAYPKAGRTTIGGRQFVNGVPLEQTAFAHDPLNPMTTSVVGDILCAQADFHVKSVSAGGDGGGLDERGTVYVFDGETDDDLRRTGCLLAGAGKLGLIAGCAGFAACLPELLLLERVQPVKPNLPQNILLLCGSVNDSSLRQMERADALGFERVVLNAAQLTDPACWGTPAGRETVARAAELLHSSGKLAVQSALPGEGRLPAGNSAAIADSMGRFAAAVLEQAGDCVLAIFGGDTAMGAMHALGGTALLPVEEVEPGVPLSVLRCGRGDVCLITKAGGLGSEAVLENIDRYVRGIAR